MGRLRKPFAILVAGAVLAGAGVYGYGRTTGGGGSPPAQGSTANIWVDDDGGTCVDNAALTAYDDATACADLSDAEGVADAGDLVMVRCDTEASCTINQTTGDTLDAVNSDWVTYRGEAGYTVTVGPWDPSVTPTHSVTVSGSKIKVENMVVPWLYATGTNLVVRDVSGSTFDFWGDLQASIDSDWSYLGNCGGAPTAQGVYFNNTDGDYLVRGNVFHDNDGTDCGGTHLDCVQSSKNASMMFENNVVGPNCGDGDGFIIGDGGTGGSNLDNGTIRNNYFYSTSDGAEINFSGEPSCTNWDVSFNTVAPQLDYAYPISVFQSCVVAGLGNIYSHTDSFICGNFPTGWNRMMVMTGTIETGCGANSLVASGSQFVSLPTDPHLVAGADAIDAGGATCPDGDIDGDLRSGTCDIGADEYDNAGNGDAPDWYVDDAGSDATLCTSVYPCLTVDRAYDLAGAGDVVAVMSGTYANQTVTGDFSKVEMASPIVVQPAPGATVTLGTGTTNPGLTVDADNLTVQDMTINHWQIDAGTGVTMRNIDSEVFTINACTDCLVQGGDVGPYDANARSGVEDTQIGSGFNTPAGCGGASGDGTACRLDIVGLTLDGIAFHDYTDVGDPAAHVDCLQFYEGEDVVIENNTFDDTCGEANDVFIRGDAGPIDGFVIQNNMSYRVNDSADEFSIRLSGNSCPGGASSCVPPCANVTIQNNTVKQKIGANCTVTNGVIRGNINLGTTSYHCDSNDNDPQGKYGTEAGWVYSLNVVGSGGVKCDASDIQSDVTFVSSTTDLHLSGGAGAADNALADPHATLDIDGATRASTADIGADER